ncbi:hypothetical protein SynWH8103_01479 [Synechococcus sp. WH 8103]|nr:hypothetical protein SynA18461_01512 [Synechococcus sp. A18-46.1]CRY92206.1 hypothetical protein SynWH8103_01479 [Synechococcus sp. WH 8103]
MDQERSQTSNSTAKTPPNTRNGVAMVTRDWVSIQNSASLVILMALVHGCQTGDTH